MRDPNQEFVALLGAELYEKVVAHVRLVTERFPDETDEQFDFGVRLDTSFLLIDMRSLGTGFQGAIRIAHQRIAVLGKEASELLDKVLEASLLANKDALIQHYRDRLGPLTEAVVLKILGSNAN